MNEQKRKEAPPINVGIVCNKCGGKGCEICHSGWECSIEEYGVCNKCEMGWKLGRNKK